MKPSANIAITGASSGLGAALAFDYAAPGRKLFLAARRDDKLRDVAQTCRKKGAEVFLSKVDIRNPKEIETWVDNIEMKHALDLMIANAGIFSGPGPDDKLESATDTARMIETNLTGALVTGNAAAGYMIGRRQGHIALVSSLAALQPLADAPAYSATKAGLAAFGEALRERLATDNVLVSVILPGHIKTIQTDIHMGPTPGIISAQQAAHQIRARLDRGHAVIALPHAMHWLVRLGRLLPWRARAIVNRPYRFHIKTSSKQDQTDEQE